MTSSSAAAGATDEQSSVARVTDVSKTFGATTALDRVHLDVAAGEVHALVGRNGAGKSTLVSILTGLQAPDSGTVELGGRPAPGLGDRDAWRQRVACVYQKLTVIDQLSVAENLFLNRQGEPGRPISWKLLRSRAADLLDEWHLEVDPTITAGTLNAEQKQYVEIARALSYGARFVILDEPTARLDGLGVQRLFERVRGLQAQGVTFLYISHHLQEVFELCDRVTVFRDARHVRTDAIGDISHGRLVEAMTGEKVAARTDPRPPAPAPSASVLEVEALSGPTYADVSLAVQAGEIVGLAGGGSSGKFDVADAIVGLTTPRTGSVRIAGSVLRPGSVPRALRAGVGFVPRDRHAQGFVEGLSVAENLTMTVPHRLGRHGWLDPGRRTEVAEEMIRRLDVVPPRPEQAVGELSGGNQQKVVAGRALADEPRVLVLMTPTAGVDVRSKESLMASAVGAAAGGAGVLLVTDDLEDLRYCHRLVVLFRGHVVAEHSESWEDRELVAEMEGMELTT